MGAKKDTNVYLTLLSNLNITESNVKDKINFSDDRSDPAENPGHPETYLSSVDKNMKITWHGVNWGNSTVKIKEVSKKTNSPADILKKDKYTDTNDDGVVVGQVKDTQVSGDETYNVKFTIDGTEYTIDPRLKMN